MAYALKLPDLGEGITEGEIARWLVSEGQEVAEDDPLVEIQTDKTTVEIPSPAAGKVTQILVEEGKVVPVGTVLVVIGGDGDGARKEPDATESAPTGAPPAKGRATPLVRKIAQELGVDLDSLTGTGPQGRITEDDVRGAAAPSEGRREPLRGVRRVIAEHMRGVIETLGLDAACGCRQQDHFVGAHGVEGLRAGAPALSRAERAARRERPRLPRPLRLGRCSANGERSGRSRRA